MCVLLSDSAMQLKVTLTVGDPEGPGIAELGALRLRVMSEWADCAELTGPFGEGELEWKQNGGSEEDGDEEEGEGETKAAGLQPVQKSFSATFSTIVNPKVSDRRDLEAFNKDPTMYAVLLNEIVRSIPPPEDAEEGTEPTEEPQLVPCGFLSADCSIFMMETENPVHTESYLANGLVHAEMEIMVDSVIVKSEVALPLEPLILDIKSIAGFPILNNEDTTIMRKSLYAYGAMDIGGLSCLRKFYMRPKMHGGENDNNLPVNTRLCLLPGLVDLPRFKEALTSST